MKIGFSIIMLALFICYRNQSADEISISKQVEISGIDTFVRKIPKNQSGEPDFFYFQAKDLEKDLDLPNIEYGVDSLEIRIWYGFSKDTGQTVVINNINNKWSAELITFRVFRYSLNDSFQVEAKVEIKTPASGWDQFIRQVMQLKVDSLPDQNLLDNYNHSTPAHYVFFEVSKKNSYSIYGYLSPEINRSVFKEVDTAMHLLDVVEKEFQFKRIVDY